MENPDTSTGWHSQQLYELDPVTGQLRPIEGDGPFGMVEVSIGDMIGYGEMVMGKYLFTQTESILSITFQES